MRICKDFRNRSTVFVYMLMEQSNVSLQSLVTHCSYPKELLLVSAILKVEAIRPVARYSHYQEKRKNI